ncbi:MAG: beta-N-acetylhexosaminidase [Myxococcota bacterium]
MASEQPGQILFTGFEGTRLPADLAELIGQGRIGGVVLFARNLCDPEQVRSLVDELHDRAPSSAPLTVAIDQEGGRVQRLRAPWTEWPPMRRLGERDSIDDTRAVARALGRELADLRVDLNFAPVVDVDTNPDNPVIGDRSFSRNAEDVGRHAAAFVEAIQDQGVAACAKHFPGHGDTAVDSHFELPRIDHDLERLRSVELPPFRAAVEAGVAAVMTAHILMSKLNREVPATFARESLELLRGEVGFTGLVFADDFEMAAIADRFPPEVGTRAALEAGVDSVLVCKRSDLRDRVLAALEASEDTLLAPALEHVAAFKGRHSGGRFAAGGTPPYPEHQELAERLR